MFKVQTHDPKSLRWWYGHRDEIDFDPPYQRKGRLWSKTDKSYLIDSIINAYDIPKIYLADFTLVNTELNNKNKPYAIIDGRQRLEAIFDFFRDEIALLEDFVYNKDPSLNIGKLTYSDLKKSYPAIAETFEDFILHVMSVVTDEESKINELFVRLNRSKPLTGAEIRNAMSGIVPALIRDIAGHSFFEECIRFSTKRGQDKNAAAKLLVIEFRGRFVDTKKVHLDRFVQEGIKTESTDFSRAAERVMKVLDDMVAIFGPRDPLLTSQGIMPVYYWLVRKYGKLPYLREFLLRFEERRRNNRQLAKENPEQADQELLAYDVLNRSTNDQNSLRGRFEVIEQRLHAFANERGQELSKVS